MHLSNADGVTSSKLCLSHADAVTSSSLEQISSIPEYQAAVETYSRRIRLL